MSVPADLHLAARLWLMGQMRESLIVLGKLFDPADSRAVVGRALDELPKPRRIATPPRRPDDVISELDSAASAINTTHTHTAHMSLAKSFLKATQSLEALHPLQRETASALAPLPEASCLRVAVLGAFSSGKSSLLNALLGQDLLATGLVPVTATMTVIRYGDVAKATWTDAAGAEVTATLEQAVANTDNRESTNHSTVRVELQLPADILKQVTLIDTPGLDSGFEHHDAAFHHVIASSDAVLWVFNATRPGSDRERQGLQSAQSQTGLTIGLVNQIDAIRPSPKRKPERWKSEVDGVIKDLKKNFGDSIHTWIATSAPWITAGDDRGGLAQILEALAEVEQAKQTIRQRAQRQSLELASHRALALTDFQKRERQARAQRQRSKQERDERFIEQTNADWKEEAAIAARLKQDKTPRPLPLATRQGLLGTLTPQLVRKHSRRPSLAPDEQDALYDAVVSLEAHARWLNLGPGPEQTWKNTVAQVWSRQTPTVDPSPWLANDETDTALQLQDLLAVPHDGSASPFGVMHAVPRPAINEPWQVLYFLGQTGLELTHQLKEDLPTGKSLLDRLFVPATVRAHLAVRQDKEVDLPTGTPVANAFQAAGIPGVDRVLRWHRLKRGSGIIAVPALCGLLVMSAIQVSDIGLGRAQDIRGWMDQVSERITLAISLVAPPEFSMQVDDAVTIPAGTDTLGSPRGEPNRQSDEPQSDVTFDRSFAMMPTEVTQWQWSHLMGEDPNATRTRAWPNPGSEPCDTVGLGDDLPVTCVSWLDAIHYANAASIEAGLPQAYVIDGDAVTWLRESLGYRLPTEAEWEYAARAGGDGAWGVPEVDCERVQSRESCSTNSGLEPARSGAPNAWGLHHTVGNAWEWTWDWYGRYPSDRSGYAGPESGSARTLRGGSGLNGFHIMRVANRYEIQPDAQSEWVGLRLVRSLEVPQ